MIVQDPCFKLKVYLLTLLFGNAVVIASSPERAKRMMVEYTSREEWAGAEDIELIIKEQIIMESI